MPIPLITTPSSPSHLKTRWNIKEKFSEETTIGLRKMGTLRYGENPTPGGGSLPRIRKPPRGAWYRPMFFKVKKYLSTITWIAEAAWQLALSFTEPACVIVKHNNPLRRPPRGEPRPSFPLGAQWADPVSAFGGIVGFNRAVDRETAEELTKNFF